MCFFLLICTTVIMVIQLSIVSSSPFDYQLRQTFDSFHQKILLPTKASSPSSQPDSLPVKVQDIFLRAVRQNNNRLMTNKIDKFIPGIESSSDDILLFGERVHGQAVSDFCFGLLHNDHLRESEAVIFKSQRQILGIVVSATVSLPIYWFRHFQSPNRISVLECTVDENRVKLERLEIKSEMIRLRRTFLEFELSQWTRSSTIGVNGFRSTMILLNSDWDQGYFFPVIGYPVLHIETRQRIVRPAITEICDVSIGIHQPCCRWPLTFLTYSFFPKHQPCCRWPFELRRHEHGMRQIVTEIIRFHRCIGTTTHLFDGYNRRTCRTSKFDPMILSIKTPNGSIKSSIVDNLDAAECTIMNN